MSRAAGRAGWLLSDIGLAALAALASCRAATPAPNPMPPASAEHPRAESATVERAAPPRIAFEISPVEVTGRFGAPSSKDVRLTGELAPQARLTIVRVEGTEIVASLLPPEGERAAGVRLTLSGRRVGQEVGQVVVSTGLVDPKELVLYCGWKVPGNLTVTPSNPYLNLRLSGPHVVQIAVASRRPDFRLGRAEVTAGPFAARVLPATAGGPRIIEVRLIEAGLAGGERGFLGKLVFVSNDPAEPRKEVPLFALGAPDQATTSAH